MAMASGTAEAVLKIVARRMILVSVAVALLAHAFFSKELFPHLGVGCLFLLWAWVLGCETDSATMMVAYALLNGYALGLGILSAKPARTLKTHAAPRGRGMAEKAPTPAMSNSRNGDGSCGGRGGHQPKGVDDWLEPKSRTHRGSPTTPSALDNSFSDAGAASFRVRSWRYLTTGGKEPSAPALFSPVGVHTFMRRGGGARPLPHAAANVPSLRRHLEAHPASFFLVVNWLLPGPPHRAVVFCFERTAPAGADPVAEGLLGRFLASPDAERRRRFKYLPRIDVAPAFVLGGVRLVGGEKPTLLCNQLASSFVQGPNYLEVCEAAKAGIFFYLSIYLSIYISVSIYIQTSIFLSSNCSIYLGNNGIPSRALTNLLL